MGSEYIENNGKYKQLSSEERGKIGWFHFCDVLIYLLNWLHCFISSTYPMMTS
jgi:hypothetical protein